MDSRTHQCRQSSLVAKLGSPYVDMGAAMREGVGMVEQVRYEIKSDLQII